MVSFRDIAAEIEILKIRIEDLEKEHKRLRKMMMANKPKGLSAIDYSKERVQSSFAPYPFDVILERMNNIEEKIEPLYRELEAKEAVIKSIKDKVDSMTGLDYKVAYMRDIEGMSLYTIADELGYSYDWIKKKSMAIK